MTASIDAVIAANRFGLGARPGEIADIGSSSRDWLKEQVARPQSLPASIKALPSSAAVFGTYREALQMRREAKDQPAPESDKARDIAVNIRQKLAPLYLDQVAARDQLALTSKASFNERLVHFRTCRAALPSCCLRLSRIPR